jgi:hypothetical protein
VDRKHELQMYSRDRVGGRGGEAREVDQINGYIGEGR